MGADATKVTHVGWFLAWGSEAVVGSTVCTNQGISVCSGTLVFAHETFKNPDGEGWTAWVAWRLLLWEG